MEKDGASRPIYKHCPLTYNTTNCIAFPATHTVRPFYKFIITVLLINLKKSALIQTKTGIVLLYLRKPLKRRTDVFLKNPWRDLLKANSSLTFFPFTTELMYLKLLPKRGLRSTIRMISIHFDRVALWDCRHHVQIILGKCYEYILAVTTWNLSTSARMVLGKKQGSEWSR